MVPSAPLRLSPQLNMLLPDLGTLPQLALPPGYSARHYRPGDHLEWERVIGESFQWETPQGRFASLMRFESAFRPERVWFICREVDGAAVATASAWYQGIYGRQTGTIHMVGALASEKGKGLGTQVTLAALHQIARDGRTAAVLQTDDFRVPAIVCYLKLGFQPLLIDENQRQRWRDVFVGLGRLDLVSRFAAILDGPIYRTISERPNLDGPEQYAPVWRWQPQREHRGGWPRGTTDADFLGDESLYRASRLGSAGVTPASVVVGAELTVPLQLRFRAGAEALATGTTVTFALRGQAPLGFTWQTNDPAKPGFCRLEGPTHCHLASAPSGFRIEAGGLAPGETVTLTLVAGEGLHWSPLARRREFRVLIDLGGGEMMRRLPEPLTIDFEPGPAHHLDTVAACTRRPGEPVRVQVTVRDRHDNRVPLAGDLRLSIGRTRQRLPVLQGVARAAVEVAGDELMRAAARLSEPQLTGVSNPVLTTDDLQLFVGDLHAHDLMSHAEGYTDEVYRWAQEERGLDFVCVPVQAHGWLDNDKWTVAKYMNQRHLTEGRFVTFLGFEWQHAGYGDKVVMYLNGDQPYLPPDERRSNCPARLYEALRASDAVAIGHHSAYPYPGWVPGTDYAEVETDVERVIELWSMHGSSEGYDPDDRPLSPMNHANTVYDALRRGLRLGFVAGSDTHSGRPGGSAREPRRYWGGLTGVWASRLRRPDLFEAIRERRTYALTGARIVLRLSVNGAPMGATLPACTTADVRVDVWAPGKIAKVELLKNTRVIRVFARRGAEAHLQIEDRPHGPAFYHCRVTQADGQLAVSSPVWLG